MNTEILKNEFQYLTEADLEVLMNEVEDIGKDGVRRVASRLNDFRKEVFFDSDDGFGYRDSFSSTNSAEHQLLIAYYCYYFIKELSDDYKVYPEYNLENLQGHSAKLPKGYSPDVTVTDGFNCPIFFIEIEDNAHDRLTDSTKKKIEKCFEYIDTLETVYVVYNVKNKAKYRKWEYGKCVMPKKEDKLPGSKLDNLVMTATSKVLP